MGYNSEHKYHTGVYEIFGANSKMRMNEFAVTMNRDLYRNGIMTSLGGHKDTIFKRVSKADEENWKTLSSRDCCDYASSRGGYGVKWLEGRGANLTISVGNMYDGDSEPDVKLSPEITPEEAIDILKDELEKRRKSGK
jgi:hypothetical protein